MNNTLPLQPNKEVCVEKSFKSDEEDRAKPKLTETRKVTWSTIIHQFHDGDTWSELQITWCPSNEDLNFKMPPLKMSSL